MDQYAADRVGNDTRFPSLTLDLHGSNSWSWNRYGVKMRGIGDPAQLFDMLFKPLLTTQKEQATAEINIEKSVLDTVARSARQLENKLGSQDRHKFQEYLNAIEETGRRLNRTGYWIGKDKPVVPVVKMPCSKSPAAKNAASLRCAVCSTSVHSPSAPTQPALSPCMYPAVTAYCNWMASKMDITR